jgi:hypothetical protein
MTGVLHATVRSWHIDRTVDGRTGVLGEAPLKACPERIVRHATDVLPSLHQTNR